MVVFGWVDVAAMAWVLAKFVAAFELVVAAFRLERGVAFVAAFA